MQHTLRTQISQRIKAVLEEKGLKQQDLADSAGMSKSYLSRIINVTINPTIDTIEQLQNALKTPILQCPK
jgi:transcriptional regulator with XRE-family HTH domain